MRSPFALGGILVLCACSPTPEPPAPPPAPEHGPVVATAIERLERELEASAPNKDEGNLDAEEVAEQVRGLIEILASGDRSIAEVALEEIALVGLPALPILRSCAESDQESDGRRAAALELLGALPHPDAADVLLHTIETDPLPWVRTHAAWRLGHRPQPWIVPRLLLRLKYEKNYETVVWIADTLARCHNYSGLGVLFTILNSASDPADQEQARARLQAILAELDFEDAGEAWQAWLTNDPEERLPEPLDSPRLRLEIWRWVQRLGEFQLRGVDDGRYLFESMGPHAARILGQALSDEDVYVRVHAAQSLQRIGPRAAVAGPDLVAALADPDLAANAALAIGSIQYEAGEAALLHGLTGGDPDLRLACARGLGYFGDKASAQATGGLRALLEEELSDELRQAVEESLVRLGQGDDLVEGLSRWLTSNQVESASSRRAFEVWLRGRADGGSEDAAQLLEEWLALELPPNTILTPEERAVLEEKRSEFILRAARALP